MEEDRAASPLAAAGEVVVENEHQIVERVVAPHAIRAVASGQADGAIVAPARRILAPALVAPQRLELEITESALLADNASTAATLHALRQFGVRIALDDFGTGYSSLSYLRGFPFDKIKIDRSFVRDLAKRRDCTAIVTAISNLARSLGIATTAEGVETKEQLDFLRAQGCTQAQGFLFSPARPRADLAALLGRLNGGEMAAA